jgi:hypothetical protein
MENGGGGKFKYEIFIYCKNFYTCHNVSPPSTTVKKKKRNDDQVGFIPENARKVQYPQINTYI